MAKAKKEGQKKNILDIDYSHPPAGMQCADVPHIANEEKHEVAESFTVEVKNGDPAVINSPESMPVKKTRGIVIMAFRHNVYARYASNLALSLTQDYQDLYKKGDEIKLCYVCDQGRLNELSPEQQFLFHKRKILSSDACENPFLAKLHLYELSPFDETLFLDADTLLIPNVKIRDIFDSFKDVDFTIANRGLLKDGYDWCSVEELKQAAGVENIYNVASEFIYFKKCEKVRQLFEHAAEFYSSNNIVNRHIANFQPDEPAIAYGMAKTGIQPHQSPFNPTFWEGHYKNKVWGRPDVYAKQILSIGGAEQVKKIKEIYDSIIKYYSATSKIEGFYLKETNKNTFVKERVLL